MATYAIGDVQGCFDALQALVKKIGFAPSRDRLWFVGDLVNRGPRSADVLRYVQSLGDRAIAVQGNHDLHLLAVRYGGAKQRADDTFDDVLAAPDCEQLLDWLRWRPMLHFEDAHIMVHAGLMPSWTLAQAQVLAVEVETALRGEGYRTFLAQLHGAKPEAWRDDLRGMDRLRVIVNAMTRMRFCSTDDVMDLRVKGGPDQAPRGFEPWFQVPTRKTRGVPIVCGHWSALGLLVTPDLLALDTGCVWGRALTAIRLEDRRLFQLPCPPP